MEVFAAWNLLDTRSVLFGVLVFLVLFRFLRRPRNLPPGPIGWPILGNLPQLMTSGEEIHKSISKLTARYGNVVSLNMAGIQVVVLHGANTVKEVFTLHQFSDRPLAHLTMSVIPGTGILTSSGEQWAEIRRFITTALRGFGVGKSSFEQNISAEAEILVEELKKHNGKAFDPQHLVGNAVSNVICSVVFGKRFQYTDPAFKHLLKVLNDVVSEAGAGGMFEYLPIFKKLKILPFVRMYVDILKNFFNHMHVLLGEHDHDQDVDNPRDLIDIFLKEKKAKEQQGVESLGLQTDNLVRIVGDLFGAGSETTASTLRWGILYMMAYPEIQARIQKELNDVTSRNRFPRISDKPDLPYTEAVLCEIMRMGTIAPLALPHLCSEATSIFGYNIPKGTVVLSNIWHNHFDSSVWEEPDKFHPERFLDKGGKFLPHEEFTPFGIGRRVCLGEHLAKMELFIFFTYLLHHFTFKKPEDAPPLSFKGINGTVWKPANFEVFAITRE